MFNNMIYFMIAVFIFHTGQTLHHQGDEPGRMLLSLAAGWGGLLLYSRLVFARLLRNLRQGKDTESRAVQAYQTAVLRISILALCLFALDVYFWGLMYWIGQVPWAGPDFVFQGLAAMLVFLLYLAGMWYFARPVYEIVFHTGISTRTFVFSNLKLNVPLLIPWAALLVFFDLLLLFPRLQVAWLFRDLLGQILAVGAFMLVVMIFLPRFLPYWWDCKPFMASEKTRALEAFLEQSGFKYRGLLRWSLFEGRVLTAGIVGLIARYRYLLVTDQLMELLSQEELKAVLAHEMGHARYRHMLFYLLALMLFMLPLNGLSDFLPFAVMNWLPSAGLSLAKNWADSDLFAIVISLPLLLAILIYFRFVLGFFMRHFERQADLHSAQVMGGPGPTISSLEKIALYSGRIRDLPSWHHFSIRERVAFLAEADKDPRRIRKHNRFLVLWGALYFCVMLGLGYFLNFGPLTQGLKNNYVIQYLEEQFQTGPDDPNLGRLLAGVYLEKGREAEATRVYTQLIARHPGQAEAFNNLAWILATTKDKTLQNPGRALDLAKQAVELERIPEYLDTLAEAYFVNGFRAEAVRTAEEALAAARTRKAYYQQQLERFKGQDS